MTRTANATTDELGYKTKALNSAYTYQPQVPTMGSLNRAVIENQIEKFFSKEKKRND